MVSVMDGGMHNSVVGNSVVSNSMVGSVVNNGGGVVNSVVGQRGVVDYRGGVVDSMVGHRGGVNSMVDRGSVGNGTAGKGCEGNLGISLRGRQDGGEEGGNGECLHVVALLED